MFENRMNPFENIHLLEKHGSAVIYTHRYNMALNKFRSSLFKGKMLCLKSKVLYRGHALYDLEALKPDLHVRASCYSGIKVVPVRSIIGSEGRATDFDIEFHPVNEAGRERWVNVAIAYLSFLPLPPIQLIQIGDGYFVRDGHHRISVGRAFGQIAMDAEVITWTASPPFPWQPDVYMPGETLLAREP
ncbi:MAG: hypothetical protein EHM40_11385 [Chloroflexi bacterium]|nr:MAG: hypothetical protein EHM40_11385 [Chloroflexota bacterium]